MIGVGLELHSDQVLMNDFELVRDCKTDVMKSFWSVLNGIVKGRARNAPSYTL